MKRSWISTIGALALTAAVLGGCSSDSDDTPDDDATPTEVDESAPAGDDGADEGADSSEGASTKKPTVNDIRDSQGSVEGYEGALEDATIEVCAVEEGAMKMGGTVTNPLEDARQYRIYVSVMEGTETRGVAQVDVEPVDPGATAFWETSLAISDPDLDCLLRVERFAPL